MARMAPKPSKIMWKLVDTYDLWSGHLSGLNSGSAMLLLAIGVAGRPANSTVATSIQVGKLHLCNQFAPGEVSKQSPSRKQLQPTLWEWNCMIACTHHTVLDVQVSWKKPKALGQLSTWTWPSANCRLLFCSQNLMCYPWVSKCTDRSRWSLATVTSGHGHPSILGATAIVEHQP